MSSPSTRFSAPHHSPRTPPPPPCSPQRINLPSSFEWADGAEVQWALGFLAALLRYARGGNTSSFNGKVPPHRAGRYPLLDELVARAAVDAGVAAPPWNGSRASADDGAYDALAAALGVAYGPNGGLGGGPRPLPADFLRLENTLPGTRVIWSINDLPLPPLPFNLGDGRPHVETRRRRLCARRAAILGERPTLITGPTEANAIREFGHSELGVERVAENFYKPPPARALLLDRGRVRAAVHATRFGRGVPRVSIAWAVSCAAVLCEGARTRCC